MDALSGHVEVSAWISAEALACGRPRLWVERIGDLALLPDERDASRVRAAFVVPRGLIELHAELWLEKLDGCRVRCDARRVRIHHADEALAASLPLEDGGRLYGSLDFPVVAARAAPGARVDVLGWIWSSGRAIRRVWVETADGRTPLEYEIARPDVVDRFPDVPNADRCGIRGELRAPTTKTSFDVELFLELEDGERVRWMTRHIRIAESSAPRNHAPQPGWSNRLRSLARALTGREPPPAVAPRSVRDDVPDPSSSCDIVEHDRAVAYEQWCRTNHLTPRLRRRLSEVARALEPNGPKVSFLLPLHEASVARVRRLVASLRRQIYPGWELLVLDDGSSGPYLPRALAACAAEEPRVRCFFERADGIGVALDRLIEEATHDFVAILDDRVVLPDDSLVHVAKRLAEQPDVDLLYTDEDDIDARGVRSEPRFKPQWNRALALVHAYVGRLLVVRRDRIRAAGGLAVGTEGAYEHDLILRLDELADSARVVHVPAIGVHHIAEAPRPEARRGAREADRRCVAAALERRGHRATVVVRDGSTDHRLAWSEDLLAQRPVTILIPTRDRLDLLRRCIEAVERTVPPEALHLLVIDDHSEEEATLAYFRTLQARNPRCRVVRPPGPRKKFDFAKLVNYGVRHVETPLVLLLNNDTEANAPGWLEEMVGWMSIDGVGAVGARLVYENGTVQHAGVVIGVAGGLADHLFHHAPADADGHLGLSRRSRDAAAVTGACLLTSTALYRELGGLDEAAFAVDYNDVDYCLRVLESGRRVIFAGGAELVHAGSASRGHKADFAEKDRFVAKWGEMPDPFTNPNFYVDSPRFEIDPHRFVHTEHAPRALSALIVPSTLEADPSSELEDYLDALIRVAPELHLTRMARPAPPLGDDPERWVAAIGGVAADLPAIPDVVIAHGPRAAWGVELARQLDRPSLWYIDTRTDLHTTARALGDSQMAPLVFAACVCHATRVAFASWHCLAAFQHLAVREHHRGLPIGIAVARLEAFRTIHSRQSLRARHGVDRDAVVAVLVGSGEPARAALSMLRAEVTTYVVDGSLAALLDRPSARVSRCDAVGMADLVVVGEETPEVYPRALLEAMTLGLPAVGPAAPGFGELVAPEEHGFLVDLASCEEILSRVRRLARDRELRRFTGGHAAVQVRLLMDIRRRIGCHLDLIRETALSL